MLIRDVMTTNVITVPSNTTVGEAQKLMKEKNLRRLPVVDDGKLMGMVTPERLERVKPRTSAPLLWQITYLLSHTTVADVMRKDLVSVKPTDTVEFGLAKAQRKKVGTLIVLDRKKIVGICTTNDFFYRIVNPTLGLGEPGIRIRVSGDDIGQTSAKIIACINQLGIKIKVLWAVESKRTGKGDIVVHLAVEDARAVISELEKVGCSASIVAR